MQNDNITFIFIPTLEEEIQKMPDICLCLIIPSLFHDPRSIVYQWKGLDETSMEQLRSWKLAQGKRRYSYFSLGGVLLKRFKIAPQLAYENTSSLISTERSYRGESWRRGYKPNGLVSIKLFGIYWDTATWMGLQYNGMRMEVSDLGFGLWIDFFIRCEDSSCIYN